MTLCGIFIIVPDNCPAKEGIYDNSAPKASLIRVMAFSTFV
jgi:hypothetical protein